MLVKQTANCTLINELIDQFFVIHITKRIFERMNGEMFISGISDHTIH